MTWSIEGIDFVELAASAGITITVQQILLAGPPLNGQTKIAVTGTAVNLPANALKNGVIISAKSSNTAPISIGGSSVNNTINGTGNGYILEAGVSVSFAVDDTSRLWINGTAGDIISFAGS